MSFEAKLSELGYTLDPVDLDNGKFVLATQTGNLIFTSGCVPVWGEQSYKGKIGADLTVDDGYDAAKLATLNCLQAIKQVSGSLDDIVRIVKVFGMVNVAPDFDNTPGVIHGCSDLLREVFGDVGLHARSAIGLTVPFNFAVEIEMIVEVK
ncbi:MAG: RidA family protein [Chloroflexota bacterium]